MLGLWVRKERNSKKFMLSAIGKCAIKFDV